MAHSMARLVSVCRRHVSNPLMLAGRNCSNISQDVPASAQKSCGEETEYVPVYSTDPAPLFFNTEVQSILKKIARVDLKKLFRRNPMEPEEPVYTFATSEDSILRDKEHIERGTKKLQMPPVLMERKPVERFISCEPRVQGFDNFNYIFIDVSVGLKNKERYVVVREPNGTLRTASWPERHRMTEIFHPCEGREFFTPKMFVGEHLKEMLKRQEYEYVLNRAAVQFEPDDPDYIRVTSTVYDHINETREFFFLHSTRHFGTMTFYLVFQKKMDNLLVDMIEQERISDAAQLVRLFQLFHPESETAKLVTDFTDKVAVIKAYAKHDSFKKPSVELAIQTYAELESQRAQVQEDIKQAHGITS